MWELLSRPVEKDPAVAGSAHSEGDEQGTAGPFQSRA